ncbi:MAG TPA: hypothetical protein VGR78_18620 [Verrucomicrobiae bacterium]|jgi:hypothetical protein|nr:hypothetical protein [Verrucomicrobiae bacterium]
MNKTANQMKILELTVAGFIIAFCGCASSSVRQTWKSPAYHGGPMENVAVLAMDERDLHRQAIENHFAGILKEQGQSALTTHQLFGLPQIKADREVAAARVRQAGGDSVLIVRLLDSATYSRQVHANSAGLSSSSGDGSGDWSSYSFAYFGTDTVWSNMRIEVYLESALYELKTGQRLWSGVTRTVLKEDMDRVAEITPLASQIFAAMRKDQVIH